MSPDIATSPARLRARIAFAPHVAVQAAAPVCPTKALSRKALSQCPVMAMVALAATALVAATAAVAHPQRVNPRAALTPAPVCTNAIQQRELLRDERGQLAQFTREGFAQHGGEVLITGSRNATFGPSADGRMQLTSNDSLVALLRRADGSTQAFAAPALEPYELKFTVPVPLSDSTWGVFLLTRRPDSSRATDVAGPIYMMTIRSNDEPTVEQIPLPNGVQPTLATDPSLATRGDRAVLALPATDRNGESVALLLERNARGWSSRVLGIPQISYVAVAFDGAKGDLVLAVVRPDLRPQRDRNSLFVYFVERASNMAYLVATGGSRGIHKPRIVPTPTGVMLAWHRRDRMNQSFVDHPVSVAFVHHGTPRAPVELGASAAQVVALGSESMPPLVLLTSQTDDGENELSLLGPPSTSARVRLRVPTAGAQATSAVLLSQPENEQQNTQLLVTHPVVLGGGTHVASELLWISTRCDASGGGM